MTATLLKPPDVRPGNGGTPARRAVVRWAWRLFRRQWRQQLLVVSLLTVAVAATTFGLGLVLNLPKSVEAEFGTANTSITVTNASRATDVLAAAKQTFGTVDVIEHRRIGIAGSVNPLDLRAQNPNGSYGKDMLRLVSGHWPSGPNEVALTKGVADLYGTRVGGTWNASGQSRQVVGLVESPFDLQDDFALVAPGQLTQPDSIQLLVHTSMDTLHTFHPGGDAGIARTDQDAATQRRIQAMSVLLIATVGMLFIGLLAAAGFTTLVQRRQRALGMLAAIGATDRHVKLVMLANGLIVGTVGAAVGVGAGLTGWIVFAPTFERIAQHRIDLFGLPWWAVGSAGLLAVVTATAASWWPARAAARTSIVSALSGRPAPPRPTHRFAAAGLVLAVAGYVLLVLAEQRHAVMVVAGVLCTTFGVLLLAPIGLRILASVAAHTPVAVRLALRDLARYQARSGAAVAAISLAIGIAATIALAAAASAASHEKAYGNLPANALVIRSQPDLGPIIELTDDQLTTLNALARTIASSVGATAPIELDLAENTTPISQGGVIVGGPSTTATRHEVAMLGKVTIKPHSTEIQGMLQPYVATPAVLAAFGIDTSTIDPSADIITSRTDLGGLSLLTGPMPGANPKARDTYTPKIQVLPNLPQYTSEPSTLMTQQAMQKFGLKPAASAWLVNAAHPLTRSQTDDAIHRAAAAGVSIETRTNSVRSLDQLRDWSTAIGILTALAVLAMTVGLIRAEAANDVRTLTATGASASVRRTLTAATAAALGLLGGVMGTAAAYLALLAWNHKHPGTLSNVPVLDLTLIVLGLPLVAAIGGWLLAGREPEAIARRPLD